MANSNTDVLQRLRDGIASLTTSEQWTQYLDVQRKFHQYSWGNCMLIALQRPDATRVAGYRSWQELGRQVRRGERAITILAPITYKRRLEDDTDVTMDERVVRGFRTVPVFDLSQTDGKPLPQIVQRLTASEPAFAIRRLQVVAGQFGFSVSWEIELPGERNGDCDFEHRRIRIRSELAGAQQVKTLAHELGHALLHDPERLGDRPMTRDLAELEAESVAYVVCQELGIDSGDYSFGYIANWAGNGERAIKGIELSAAQIQRAAHSVLSGLQSSDPSPPDPEKSKPRQRPIQNLPEEISTVIPVGSGGMDWPEPVHTVDGMKQPTLLLTVEEACSELRVSRAQLYIMAKKQHVIEMVHIGRACRIPRASLEAYVTQLRLEAQPSRVAPTAEVELES